MTQTQIEAVTAPDEALIDDDVKETTSDDSAPLRGAAKVSSKRVDPDEDDEESESAGSRRVSLSLRTLAVASGFILLLAGIGFLAWLYTGERSVVEAQQRKADASQHAEQIALDYAVNAATMNFQDLNAWKGKLVNGTSPSLNDKLTKAAASMEQILIPLEWSSTAEPLVAKVRSDTNGMYVVDTFVSVLTKTTQAPDNLQSTATYSITIDSKNNWQISDVGGISAVVTPK